MYHLEDNSIRTEEKRMDEKILGGVGYVCYNYMKKHCDNVAQIDVTTGEAVTFDHLLKRSVKTSIALKQRGVAQGDIITYYSNIHLNACVPILASFFIGSIPSFIDTSLSLSDSSCLFKQLKPKLILTDFEFLNEVHGILKAAQVDLNVEIFDDNFFNCQENETDFKPIYIENLEDVAIIHFSSGSTGLPKGILLNHYFLLFCEYLEEEDFWKEGELKISFSQDSFYWGTETGRLVSSIREGSCKLISPKQLHGTEIWNILEKYKVNVADLIPYDIIAMCDSGKPSDVHLNSLTTVFPEGAPLPIKHQMMLQKLLPNTDIFITYGQTEVGMLTVFHKNDLHKEYSRKKIGSIGVPSVGYGICFKVVDLESGKNLGPNQTGELRVRSKTVMRGYYNMNSSDAFDEDGWLKSGDLVYYDEDYCFFVVGRIKELIIWQGWHITPASVEVQLMTHPAVKMAVVIGIPDDEDGEHPIGVVVPNEDSIAVQSEDIEKYMQEKFPVRYKLKVKVMDDIPLTPTGKVKRQELRTYILSSNI